MNSAFYSSAGRSHFINKDTDFIVSVSNGLSQFYTTLFSNRTQYAHCFRLQQKCHSQINFIRRKQNVFPKILYLLFVDSLPPANYLHFCSSSISFVRYIVGTITLLQPLTLKNQVCSVCLLTVLSILLSRFLCDHATCYKPGYK